MKTNKYANDITLRVFFSLIPVQILLVLCGGLNVVIDGVFASNLIGPDAMAVTGLYAPFAKILDTINALFFGGAQILCGMYLGENLIKKARNVFTIDIAFIALIGSVATILCFTIPGLLSDILGGVDNPLKEDLIGYFRGVAIGIVPFLLSTQLTAFLQLEKQAILGYISIGSMFAANIICNYTFIKVFDMGIVGLGLATAVSNWVSFLILISYYFRKKTTFRMVLKDINLVDFGDIVKYGMPNAATQFLIAVRSIALNSIITTGVGTAGLAAFATVNSFGYLYWAVPAGVTSAMMTLATIYTGEQDKNALSLLANIYIKRAVPVVCLASSVFMILAFPITNMYYHDPKSAVYGMTLLGLILFPMSSPISAVIVGFTNFWRCMNHKWPVRIIIVGDGIASVVLLSYLLVKPFGMTGIWLGQVLGCALLVVIIYIIAAIYNKKIPTKIFDLCCIKKGFGAEDNRRLAFSVRSIEDITGITDYVMDFCKGLSVDARKSNWVAVCIEELAGNIVKHGFSKKSDSVADISVVVLDDKILIRFKDNCKPFNPVEQSELFNPEDITHNIGLRMVGRMCKSMEYQSLLGLNVFTIQI